LDAPAGLRLEGVMKTPRSLRLIQAAWGLTTALLLVAGVALAQAPAASPAPPAEDESQLDADALDLARKAFDFLRQQQRFSFHAETGYEVLQEDGSKLEFGGAKTYTVKRPESVRVETEERDGDRRLTVFDGKNLTVSDPDLKVYAQLTLEQPRDIDGFVDVARDRLEMPVPLAELLKNDPRKAMEDSLEVAYLVGEEKIAGAACDHLAFRNPDVDAQLWFSRGAQPTLRRIVITYRKLEGQPSFWADLSDWSFAPKLTEATFRFTPAPDESRILFALAPPAASTPEGGAR
jgi:hypothetical protein